MARSNEYPEQSTAPEQTFDAEGETGPLKSDKNEAEVQDDGPAGYLQAKSNAAIRRMFQMHTIESEQRIERLNWMKSQIKHPDENVLLHASLFGHYAFESESTLDEGGRVRANANSFARQFEDDL
jgi:hypothetical protein